jgi:hypothetical protein
MVTRNDINKFLTTITNNTTISNIMFLIDVLDNNGVKGYLEELSEWYNVDEVNVDPIQKLDNTIHIVKKYTIQFLKTRGLILDKEQINEMSLDFLSNLTIAVFGLQALDISGALYITGILQDELQNRDLDKLYLILFYVNPNLNVDNFSKFVIDVSPKLFDILSKVCDNIINSEDIQPDDIDHSLIDDITILIDEFLKLGFKSVPDILLSIMNYPDLIINIRNNYNEQQSQILKKIFFILKDIQDVTELETSPYFVDLLYSLVDLFIIGIIGDGKIDDDREELLLAISDLPNDIKNKFIEMIDKVYNDIDNSKFKIKLLEIVDKAIPKEGDENE